MTKLIITTLLLLFHSLGYSQNDNVEGNITTKDTAKVSVLGIYPDNFPNISVVFRAEKTDGEPVFGLEINDMNVSENGQKCKVISIDGLSKKKPINIGIVIDHSGSMLWDEKQLFDLGIDPWFIDADTLGRPVFPDEYNAPIDLAKEAVSKFVESFEFKKDKISVVGFSSVVDKTLKLSNNKTAINEIIVSMEADSMTAFYDACIVGIDQVKNSEGLKVLVALTDGQDNQSKNTFNEVIESANEFEIPIYIIGLGNVNSDSLQLIADKTNGQYFYANSANALTKIYEEISMKLQAFYDMVYESPNLASADEQRTLEISFSRPGIHLISEVSKLEIPKEVLTHLEEKETEREYYIYGGTAILSLIAGSLLFFFIRKRRKPKLQLTKVYPNPNKGILNIEVLENTSEKGKLIILNQSGQIMKEINISANERNINLSELKNGLYIACVEFDEQKSNSVKILVKR